MTTPIPVKCFAIFQLKSNSNMQRIVEDVPEIIDLLGQVSIGNIEQVFRSNDGHLFGYFLTTIKHFNVIRASFEQCGGTRTGDNFIIFDVNDDFAAVGFSRAWNWFQHN
ncbi:MAG: hypothetical protein V7727_15500 [Sneathiella sp.]